MSRRLLFCLPTSQLSGGVKVIYQLTDRLVDAGLEVDLFSYAGPPTWASPRASFLPASDIEEVDCAAYDFVVVSNAAFIPILLPRLGTARCVFFAQDYESFHYGDGPRYADFMAETPAMSALYRLPVPIITISRPLVDVIFERTGRRADHMPVGIDKDVFREQPRSRGPHGPRRVLLVGNYLMPYKGMCDAREALAQLSAQLSLQLVVITQEYRGREFFDECAYPVELHFCPGETDVPPIIASCDVYCCASWYEGLGLPAIEAFHCGTPVVSTRTLGVDEYGRDGDNLLLAEPAAPDDLADKLRAALTDVELARRLRAGGLQTARAGFDWSDSVGCFMQAIDHIDRTYAGAGAIDYATLDRLLHDLEMQGAHTPIGVFREFQALTTELSQVEARLRRGDPPRPGDLEALRRVRDGLQTHLSHAGTQYHAAFQGAYDRCRLVLELAGSPDTQTYLSIMLRRDRPVESRADAAAFVERRYSIA